MNAEDASELDFEVPAIDALDKICKYHDLAIWRASKETDEARAREMRKQADRVFINDMIASASPGMKDEAMAFAVWAGGPSANLRQSGMLLYNFP